MVILFKSFLDDWTERVFQSRLCFWSFRGTLRAFGERVISWIAIGASRTRGTSPKPRSPLLRAGQTCTPLRQAVQALRTATSVATTLARSKGADGNGVGDRSSGGNRGLGPGRIRCSGSALVHILRVVAATVVTANVFRS